MDHTHQKSVFTPPLQLDVEPSFYQEHRNQLLQYLKSEVQDLEENSIILLIGEPTQPIDDQDTEIWPEQQHSFYYLFGVDQVDCFAIIHVNTGKTVLFVPEMPEDLKMWMVIYDQDFYIQKYQVDEVYFNNEVQSYIEKNQPQRVLIYDGIDSDSKLPPRLPDKNLYQSFKQDKTTLYPALCEIRVVKDETEINLLRFICKISSQAHVEVMQNAKPGIHEYQMQALFRYYCLERCGAKHKSYDCICASGEHSTTLHYVVNDKTVPDNAFVLNDMGSKYQGYCSDITVTFPSNGQFNEKQQQNKNFIQKEIQHVSFPSRLIYLAVLDALNTVESILKQGTEWTEMHYLAEKTMLQHLIKIGIVKDTPIEELVEKRVGAIFFPHGLGHLLGSRVHDVGGYNPGTPERLKQAGVRSLRTRRTLQAGTVITVEPGCYFIQFIIERALKDEVLSKYLNPERLAQFIDIGGVRLEDDVVVLKDKCEVLNDVPRTIDQVEAAMAGLDWQACK